MGMSMHNLIKLSPVEKARGKFKNTLETKTLTCINQYKHFLINYFTPNQS